MTIVRAGLLVSTNQLREKLKHVLWQNKIGNDVRVLDASFDFDEQNDGYKDFYKNGHIPSSLYFDPLKCSERTPQIPFNLPDVNRFTDYIQSLGVSSHTHVVTYDRMDTRAALRAWWMFKLYGHRNISILDGGLKKWVREGYPVMTDEPLVKQGNFEAKLDQSLMKDFNSMKESVESKKEQVVDARGGSGFNKVTETDSGKQINHIPGAKNIPYTELFNEDGTFKSREELKDLFQRSDVDINKPMVAMCHRGVIACGLLAVSELLGKPDIPLYYGSWYEWSRRMTQ